MTENIRKLSRADAAFAAEKIALEFASANGIQGKILGVEPDDYSKDRRGKTHVHWTAVFENVINGSVFDSPLVLNINVETGSASFAA